MFYSGMVGRYSHSFLGDDAAAASAERLGHDREICIFYFWGA